MLVWFDPLEALGSGRVMEKDIPHEVAVDRLVTSSPSGLDLVQEARPLGGSSGLRRSGLHCRCVFWEWIKRLIVWCGLFKVNCIWSCNCKCWWEEKDKCTEHALLLYILGLTHATRLKHILFNQCYLYYALLNIHFFHVLTVFNL